MMTYIQKILITILLLLAIADGCKGNNEEACVKIHDDASQTSGSCCQEPGDQPDVRINRGNTEIECRNKQQRKEITWYTYGSVVHGLDVFTNVTSGMKYTAPSSGGIFTCSTETNKSSVTSKDFCNFHKTFIIPPANVYIPATIEGLALVGAILCLVIFYIKYKGKQINVDHSYSNTVPTEYE